MWLGDLVPLLSSRVKSLCRRLHRKIVMDFMGKHRSENEVEADELDELGRREIDACVLLDQDRELHC